ncbi:MAG TPA: D-alanine--D-alanine ligase family protein [Solirubrobacteraceae bacterium]|nr:D-alanine--D-alanine ligase family protein [Solirubrobacteraceae bacterium]
MNKTDAGQGTPPARWTDTSAPVPTRAGRQGDARDTLTVAVLAGGRSSEHEVSLASGAAIADGLLAAGHEVVRVEIDREGAWRCEGKTLELGPGAGLLGADVAFPALHGPYGEDGTVQGTLETLDVAYVGAGVTASAVCLDKVLFKRLLSASEPALPQVAFVGVHDSHWRATRARVLSQIEGLGLPVFVKPAHLGSSVGIVRVTESEALPDALEQSLAHDELAIVEAAAPGIEVECGVLGLTRVERRAVADGYAASTASRRAAPGAVEEDVPAFVSEPGEIVFSGDWYDYEAKYKPGGMDLAIPARISGAARARVRRLALQTFELVGCEGLARVDFFVDGDSVLVNELNTMPGFTPTSVYAKLMAASGVPFEQLVDRLCRLAIERQEERRSRRG